MKHFHSITIRNLQAALRAVPYAQWKEAAATAGNSASQVRDEILSPYWTELEQRGAGFSAHPIPVLPFSLFQRFGQDGDRKQYELHYFERRTRLSTLAMLCLHEHDDGRRAQWRTALEDSIWEICNEYTWVLPAHVGLFHAQYPRGIWDRPAPPRESVDLFAADTAFALAEIVTLLATELHPWVISRVKDELDRRVLRVYFYDPVPQNWEMKTNNWPAVCAAGTGGAALYEIADPERLSGMLWRVLQAFDAHLSGFDEQGATPEGVGYWQFGFGYFVYFAELLRERTAGSVDLLAIPAIREIAKFPARCSLSHGMMINFSDSAPTVKLSRGLLSRLRRLFPHTWMPSGELQTTDFQSSWIPFSRNLFWAEKEVSRVAEIEEELFFPGHQWVISKVAGGKIAFAAKGGHNGEPHNHNDLGHFILHANGCNILADLGTGEYTRQYFQPEYRYDTWNAGSKGHSVPVVDGSDQAAGEAYCAQVTEYTRTESGVKFGLNLTKAYACARLERLERTFTWVKSLQKPVLTLQDEALFSSCPDSFVEVFISSIEPREETVGTIKLGAVRMRYEHRLWEANWERHTVFASGDMTTFWRIKLKRKHLTASFQCEIRFELDGDEEVREGEKVNDNGVRQLQE